MSEGGAAILGRLGWIFWFACVAYRLWTKTSAMAATGMPVGALAEYLYYIHQFWAGAPIYIAGDLHGFHYLPFMLILGAPLAWVSPAVAGAALGLLSAALLTWSVYYLAQALNPTNAIATAGMILAIAAPAATSSLPAFQLQMAMTAGMIAAAAAGMKGRWRELALWLAFAVAVKPLAIVMALLAAAAIPRTRIILIIAIAAMLAAPFALRDWGYLSTEYVNYVRQLWHINSAPPGEWTSQADFSVLLSHLGLDLDSGPRLAIRLGAALGTLLLALRIAASGSTRATAFTMLTLSVCYIGLFNPRQEVVSFLVVVPPVAAIGLLLLGRNLAGWRGWAWIILALLVGAKYAIVGWILPTIMVAIWVGLLRLQLDRTGWIELLSHAQEPAQAAIE